MDMMTKRDTRGQEIKRLLAAQYPTAHFRVRLHKFSMGESIHVKTDLLKESPYSHDIYALDCRQNRGEHLTEDEYTRWMAYRTVLAHNRQMSQDIRTHLIRYESIDRDQFGEILGGGNTYLNIERL